MLDYARGEAASFSPLRLFECEDGAFVLSAGKIVGAPPEATEDRPSRWPTAQLSAAQSEKLRAAIRSPRSPEHTRATRKMHAVREETGKRDDDVDEGWDE
jgi:hypothetical protein